jgi:mannose-6-phosphate isomerase-like protein (cupin superfamily)
VNDSTSRAPFLVRRADAPTLIEEGEFVRLYFDESRLQFSVADMAPGAQGPLDPGHEGADEVAYVLRGRLAIEFPQFAITITANEGDAIIIPAGVAHRPLNVSDEPTMLSWSLAPNHTPASR